MSQRLFLILKKTNKKSFTLEKNRQIIFIFHRWRHPSKSARLRTRPLIDDCFRALSLEFHVTRSFSDMSRLMFCFLLVFGACMSLVECTRPEECELPYETGMCRAMFRAFHFNRLTNRCEEFVYGGCGGMKGKLVSKPTTFDRFVLHLGNANRFETEEECLARCVQGNRIIHEDQ